MSIKGTPEDLSGPGARALLDDLDRTDLLLQHQKSLLGLLEETGGGSVDNGGPAQASRRPVRSPEAAEEERHSEEALLQLAADAIVPAREQVADLENRRQEILTAMAEGGCFEGRWVGKGDRAVYLQRKEASTSDERQSEGHGERPDNREPHFKLLDGPWAWVEGAPEGEDPHETLARGEVLDRRMHARNELCIILGVPAIVISLGVSLFPGALLMIPVAALATLLLVRLRQGRQRLLDHLSTNPATKRRKAQELAALAQLDSIRRGDTDVPPFRELEEAFADSLFGGSSAGGNHLRHRVEYPRLSETELEKPEDSGEKSTGEDSNESPEETIASVPAPGGAPGGMLRAAVLLSLAGGEKTLGDLLAHIRAFSGTAFAPGPAKLGECLQVLEDTGLIRQTGGEPPFARYKITPNGGVALHAQAPLGQDHRHGTGS